MAATTGIPYQFPPGTVNQPVIIIQQQQTSQPDLQNYPRNCSIGLGIAQIICGVLSIVLGIVLIGLNSSICFIGHGIWGGVCPIVAGSFGIASASSKSKCSIVTVLVLSIVAAVLNIAPFILAIIDAVLSAYYYPYYYYYGYNSGTVAVSSLLAIVLFAECVLAIIASRLACRFTCCDSCKECCGSCEEGQVTPTAQMTTYPNAFQGQICVVQGNSVTPVSMDILRAMQGQSLQAQGVCAAAGGTEELTLRPPRYGEDKRESNTPPPSYNASP